MNQFVKPVPAKNVPTMVAVSVWLCAIGAPAFVIHTNLVEAARRDAQADVISQVATTIKSSATSRGEVMQELATRAKGVGDARFVRTANRLGMPTDWQSLFAQIQKRDKTGQQKAARIIAEECGLAVDSTLKSEQSRLLNAAVMASLPVFRVRPTADIN